MKRKHEEEHENLERWLVSYADFITLLFAFFTVMYALSMTDKSKYKQAVENIERVFSSSGGVFPLRGSLFTPFDKAPDKGSQTPPSHTDIGRHSKSEQEAIDKIAYKIRQLFEKTTGVGLQSHEFEMIPTSEGFRIRLDERIVFGAGSEKLKREYVPFLYELGRHLGRLGANIQVEGHTDDRPPSMYTSNWDLSVARSSTIAKFFIEASSLPIDKVTIAGLAETKPIGMNNTPEGRAKNRRVEISVMTGNRELAKLPW